MNLFNTRNRITMKQQKYTMEEEIEEENDIEEQLIGEHEPNQVSQLVSQCNEMIANGKDVVNQVTDSFNRGVQVVEDVISLQNRIVDVWQESRRIDQNIAMINSAKEIELQKIAAKFTLCREVLAQRFGERHQGLTAHYRVLENALESNDREMIIASLKGISNIVASNPLEDFTAFMNVMEDKDKTLELDF